MNFEKLEKLCYSYRSSQSILSAIRKLQSMDNKPSLTNSSYCISYSHAPDLFDLFLIQLEKRIIEEKNELEKILDELR